MAADIIKNIKTVSMVSNLLMLLTSVHHIYGAEVYNTPWRLHILFISLPMLLITYLFTNSFKNSAGKINHVLFRVYLVLIMVVSVILFGLYEGGYNHLLKVIIYYSGLGEELFPKMYPPPPVFEVPNDFLFEFTGVLQVLIAIPLITGFVQLTGVWMKQKKLYLSQL